MTKPVVVAVGIGSNLGEPLAQVRMAISELASIEGVTLRAVSSLYRSAPLGPQDQPHYINAVALLDCVLEPLALLDALQAIENDHGRVRRQRWGARTLDLDILLWGEAVLDLPSLTVPHPGVPERAFVLYPLAELDPELAVPGRGRVAELVAACPADDLSIVEPPPH